MKLETIKLTRKEINLIYTQLQARLDYFKEDMMYWAVKGDTREIERCVNAVSRLEYVMRKLIN